jgi:hypothetical protein
MISPRKPLGIITKTVLIDQDDIAQSQSFIEQARSAAVSIGGFLIGRLPAVAPTFYSSGYDSFYQGVQMNPHPKIPTTTANGHVGVAHLKKTLTTA